MIVTYMVSFELATPSVNGEALSRLIRSNKNWAKITSTTYLVRTEKTAAELRDDLKRILSPGDKLFIATYGTPAAWFDLPESVANWILGKTTKKDE